MSIHNPSILPVTFPAGLDLSGGQFRFMTVTATGTVEPSVIGERSIGTLQNKPLSFEPAEIGIGTVKVVVGAAGVTVGDLLAPDADGKARTAEAGDIVHGIALQTGTSEEIIPMQFDAGHIIPAA